VCVRVRACVLVKAFLEQPELQFTIDLVDQFAKWKEWKVHQIWGVKEEVTLPP